MDNFDTSKWLKDQYLEEAGLLTEAGMPSPDFFYKMHKILKDFLDEKAVKAGDRMSYFSAEWPLSTAFESYMRRQLEGTPMNEAEEMAMYKVHVVTSDPYEGGPDEWFDHEVKVDASLSGDELDDAVKDAVYDLGYTRRSIYKMNYEKA